MADQDGRSTDSLLNHAWVLLQSAQSNEPTIVVDRQGVLQAIRELEQIHEQIPGTATAEAQRLKEAAGKQGPGRPLGSPEAELYLRIVFLLHQLRTLVNHRDAWRRW